MATGRQFDIPAAPVLIVAPSEYTRRDCDLEPIGVALNGVPIFSPALDRTCTQLDELADAAWAAIDFCGGSVLAGGEYGYRVPPSCLHAQAKEVGMPLSVTVTVTVTVTLTLTVTPTLTRPLRARAQDHAHHAGAG